MTYITITLKWFGIIILSLFAITLIASFFDDDKPVKQTVQVQRAQAQQAPRQLTALERVQQEIADMHELGGHCTSHARQIESLVNQFGPNTPIVTSSFHRAADANCY